MTITLPEKAEKIIRTIEDAGFEAYAVGGCVRDFLLGKKPNDWDITTSALPEEIKRLFRRTVDTGIAHGTVTVLIGKDAFEVTTYRIDGKYSDNRHPDRVEFTRSLEEDLKRRDFTINSFAFSPQKGLIDLFNGQEDLKNKVIRAVGDPKERFGEDALRILRAFRFSAQLDFSIEEETLRAAEKLKDSLQLISAERIRDELTKLLISEHPEKIEELYNSGITAVILPEFHRCMEFPQNNPHHCFTVGRHTIEALKSINRETLNKYSEILNESGESKEDVLRLLRFTMLFHDLGKCECRTVDEKGTDHFHGHADLSERAAVNILKRLKSDNHSINMISRLVRYHDYRPDSSIKNVRRSINKMGEDIFPLLFPVRYSDIMAQSSYKMEEKLKKEEVLLSLYKEILENRHCLSLKDLAVDGSILMKEAGMKSGRELGDMLKYLLEQVLEEPSWNEREILLAKARERISQVKKEME
ncbi:MAG: CCA tRNA nucleotidyltransferase [Lachnospiraceae bacterium]|nr:CCA tRNA nucleotidyltransferase [Lachnospiraceae bacterium]